MVSVAGVWLNRGMENADNTTTESSERVRRPEMVRPVRGRMLGGVAKGVAENFGIADWIPRVFFIVTAFMGGLGVILYATCWAFIRSEDESESIADRFFSGASTSRSWLGIGLIVVAGIVILSNFTFLASDVIWATAFLVVGLLLYTGNLPMGSRKGPDGAVEHKEGVQQMSSTEDTVITTPAGDSPAGLPAYQASPVVTHQEVPPKKPRETSMLGRLTFGAALVGMGILAILDNVEGIPVYPEARHYLALAVTILGVGLLVGSVVGRARWLILVGVFLVPTMVFYSAVDYDWRSERFNRQLAPLEFSDLGESHRLDVGRLDIDLSQLPWDGEEVLLDAEVAVGSLTITVPDGVGIVGEGEVSIGIVQEPGRSSSGMGERRLRWDSPGEMGTVLLDADVSIGNLEIFR